MLSAYELADMRTTFIATCDKTCTVTLPGTATPGPGGEVYGPSTTLSFPCRVMDLMGSEREVGGRLSGVADIMILMGYTEVDISMDATVTIGPDTYAIVRLASKSTQPVATRIYAQRIV